MQKLEDEEVMGRNTFQQAYLEGHIVCVNSSMAIKCTIGVYRCIEDEGSVYGGERDVGRCTSHQRDDFKVWGACGRCTQEANE